MADVLTIREAVRRAKADGLPVTEYTLRRWIKSEAIPARKVGAKILLYYPNLVRYVQCEDLPAPPQNILPGIRRIDL